MRIYFYLRYLDLIKLRIVSKEYDKKYKNYIHSLDPNNFIKNNLLHFEVKCKLEIYHSYKIATDLFKMQFDSYRAKTKNEIKRQIKKLINHHAEPNIVLMNIIIYYIYITILIFTSFFYQNLK